ncbi:hypothetical protein JKF63_03718 [Porcisia hertigi]|uniref:Uncharacterized protein n=1 Tax=Porcisia hertigi TaxID=2761500 RepID=A0A836HIQ6_9TRYP|nr:hypothetical protein JKF63_03718 [Porcisia hertigi]
MKHFDVHTHTHTHLRARHQSLYLLSSSPPPHPFYTAFLLASPLLLSAPLHLLSLLRCVCARVCLGGGVASLVLICCTPVLPEPAHRSHSLCVVYSPAFFLVVVAERTRVRTTTMPLPPRHRCPLARGLPSRSGQQQQQQRYAKKEQPRHAGKRISAAASPSSTASGSASTSREGALREALAKAIGHSGGEGGAASNSERTVDTYGNGSPTDRLQFGYSPSITAEAVAFHARFTKDAWVAARRRNGRVVFVKKQRLELTNCEPVTSILKLQSHWKQTNAFQSDARGGVGGTLKAEDLDKLVDMLASKQRIADEEEEA